MDQNRHFFIVESPRQAGRILADKISRWLDIGPVLWLLSGGSAIEVAVECAKHLSGRNLSGLTLSLVDERYGPPGHADSNWQQLQDKGLKARGAAARPFLSGNSFAKTVDEVNDFFSALARADVYKIALLGMGTDGHTAGILPASPAVYSDKLVAGYQAGDHPRITLSLAGLKKLDEAFLYAAGEDKAGPLERLSQGDIDPSTQPAQIIKTLPAWSVYNDRIGRKI